MSGRRCAFTLVELLCVMAIIAILASFLMPAVQKSVLAARSIHCLSSLRQCGVGLSMYADDYRGWIPSADETAGAYYWNDFLLGSAWGGKTSQYLADKNAMLCASQAPRKWSNHTKTYGMPRYPGWSAAQSGAVWAQVYYNLQKVKASSSFYLLGDTVIPNGSSWTWYNVGDQVFSLVHDNSNLGIHARHQGNVNMAFADGHGKACNPGYLSVLKCKSVVDENHNRYTLP